MLTKSGVLQKDEDQMKYRWNPKYDCREQWGSLLPELEAEEKKYE